MSRSFIMPKSRPFPIPPGRRKLFVQNTPSAVQECDIRNHFGQFGKVVFIEMPHNRDLHRYCFVIMEKQVEAEAAVVRGRHVIMSNNDRFELKVEFAHDQGAAARKMRPSPYYRAPSSR